MTLLALNDLDRSKNGIASGNVITGKDTLSGSAGKDGLGVAPNHVTKVNGMDVTGGQDIMGAWGKLHMNEDGSYTYTRTKTNIWDMGAPGVGTAETFTYELTDKSNNHSTATLTINLLAEAATTLDKNGTHNGTAYDDFINGENLNTVQGGLMAINGGDGADKIVGRDGVYNHLIGGVGNDWLIAGGGNLVSELEGGLGADRLDGGMNLKATATYANSKAAVTVEITADGSKNHGGDAEGDSLVSITNLIGSKFNDTLTGDGLNNAIKGGNGNDTLYGQNGEDTLEGGNGNDSLHGGNQGDVLEGGAGADHLFGDDGTDTATYTGAAAGITLNLADGSKNAGDATGDTFDSIENFKGSAFADKMIGDNNANAFAGYFGDDILSGSGGKDYLDGGDGSDVLIGGAGADTLDGGTEVYGGRKDTASYEDLLVGLKIHVGDTVLSSGDASGDIYISIEKIQGTQGDDEFWNDDSGDIELHGGKGLDTMHGGEGFNYLYGEAGDDVLLGNANALTNFFDGGAGADSMTGAAGSEDTVGYADAAAAITLDLENSALNKGDAKSDSWSSIESFVGSNFADKMYGDNGGNVFFGGGNGDTIDGRGGDDTLRGDAGNDTLTGGEGKDTLHGGEGNDKLMGGLGNDTLNGDNGNDTLQGGEDADKLHGGQGNDNLDGGLGNDLLWGDEGKDTLTGGLGNDSLYGGAENDTLNGGAGLDYLAGGDGSDKLTGGADMDIFTISVADSGKDTITDFKFGEDKLVLSDVLDDGNLGNDLQDLLDNGIQAQSNGSTLTLTENGEAFATFTGWTGPQISSIQDLSTALGGDMIVTHS